MNAVDALGFRQVLQRRGERASLLGRLHQVKDRRHIQRNRLVPRLGDPLGFPSCLALRPIHPLRERFGMRIDRAGALVERVGLHKNRIHAVPPGASIELLYHLARKLCQQAGDMQIDRRRFDAVLGEPTFADRLDPELVPHPGGNREFLLVLGFLEPARHQS